jgi:tRNA 5-methylaminomethyl-2-thiouridine biosynthesis bifunctional protein
VKTEPIVAAQVAFDADGVPHSTAFGDVYRPREGTPFDQAREVFLAGNGLPARWRGRERFTILETGFGLGHNFLATWQAWRDDAQRCARLHYVAIDKHPPTRADLVNYLARALDATPLAALGRQLADAWPPLTPNVHALRFESGRLQLLLAFGDAAALARECVLQANAFFLDGFAPARNAAMWTPALFKSLARMAAPQATAATWSAARVVRDGLAAAGFEAHAAAGPGRKRDITLGRFAPRFLPAPPPSRRLPLRAPREAIVVGAGLAGAGVARALAAQGVACTVLDAQAQPAAGASGNPAALYHGTVGAQDTPHTRWYRAASFAAAQWVRDAHVSPRGLLRLHASGDVAAMRALLAAQALPPDVVQALDAAQASERAGITITQPAWWFAQGGSADPAALVAHALAAPGVRFVADAAVASIEPTAEGWRALDAHGRELAAASILVLANAHAAMRLAGLPAAWSTRIRGQVSWFAPPPAWAALRVPVASGSYALRLPDGAVLIGATQQADDDDAQVRDADHAANLERARDLLRHELDVDVATMHGRVGWRAMTYDRLPQAGAVPDLDAPLPARRDAPRLVPRRDGLFLATGLGTRGLTSAALVGELVSAQACGTPWPLEADLADAIDPARMALKR